MNWKADWRVCYTAEKLIFSSIIFKEGRKPEVKIFPWKEKHSVLELRASSINSVFANLIKISIISVLFHTAIFNLFISKDTLERKKNNPKNQPLGCHHTEQHSCSFFWLFPAIRAIKINNINKYIYISPTQEHTDQTLWKSYFKKRYHLDWHNTLSYSRRQSRN